MASGCCIRRYIDILTIIINFPYSTCISSVCGSNIPTSLFIFKCFFGLVYVMFLLYKQTLLKEQRTFEIVQKNREHALIILESGWNLWVWLVGVVAGGGCG